MKTINGNNKLERQINKANKYLGIELVENTNKFLKIENIKDKENTYIAFGEAISYSTSKELFIIKPINANGKVFFVKEWATINESNNFYHGKYVIFQPYKLEDKLLAKELAKGADDIFNLNDYINKNGSFLVNKK